MNRKPLLKRILSAYPDYDYIGPTYTAPRNNIDEVTGILDWETGKTNVLVSLKQAKTNPLYSLFVGELYWNHSQYPIGVFKCE